MTLWLEDTHNTPGFESLMCDAVFRINCKRLPVDHAASLSKRLTEMSPWLLDLPRAGIHQVHVAGSQNGWERPATGFGGELILSRRTRLRVRIEHIYVERLIAELCGTTLEFDDYSLSILSGKAQPFTAAATLFSRYTCFDDKAITSAPESVFIRQVVAACNKMNFSPTKILCGRENKHTAGTAGTKYVLSRSVLLAEVPPVYSLKLQDEGLGQLRLMGCGLVIPHKDTGAVGGFNSQF